MFSDLSAGGTLRVALGETDTMCMKSVEKSRCSEGVDVVDVDMGICEPWSLVDLAMPDCSDRSENLSGCKAAMLSENGERASGGSSTTWRSATPPPCTLMHHSPPRA